MSSTAAIKSLLFVRRQLVVDDGEVAQLVRVLVAGDYVEVVSQLLLLQVLLGEVLEVALGERRLSCHGDARLRLSCQNNGFKVLSSRKFAARSAVITVSLASNVLLRK